MADIENNKLTMKGRIKDKILILSALTVALACLYILFFSDSNFFGPQSESSNAVAVLEEKFNVIEQKAEGALAWNDLKVNDQLYMNDQIFTKGNSTGKIRFKDGSFIEMAPKTLIKLDGAKESARINLISGLMMAKMSKSNIKIKAGQSDIDLSTSEGGQLQLSSNENGNQEITVLEGQATLKVDGEQVVVGKNQLATLSKNGKAQVQDLDIFLKNPVLQQTIFYQTLPSIQFRWDTSKKAQSYTIVISSDSNFKDVVIKNDINQNNFLLSKLADGAYFWKVEGRESTSDKLLKSPIGNFSLHRDTPPQIISPIDNEIIVMKKKGVIPVRFEWKSRFGQKYEFQIKRKDKLLKSKITQKTILTINPKNNKIEAGKYKWRVRIVDSNRKNSPWAKWHSFEIEFDDGSVFPKELIPEDNDKIQIGKNFNQPVEFSWKGRKNKNYTLQVALDIDFQRPIFEKKVDALNLNWYGRVFGKYYWRVGLTHSKNNSSPQWSRTHALELVAAAPGALFPADKETVVLYEPGPVDFRWEEVYFDDPRIKKEDKLYIVEAARQLNFEGLLFHEETFENLYRWKRPEFGDIYWRAKAQPKNAQGVWSAAYQFNLQKSKPPKPPLLLPIIRLKIKLSQSINLRQSSPLKNKKFTGRMPASTTSQNEGPKPYVDITWPKIQYVKSYVVEIYKDKQKKQKIISSEVTKNQYRWNNPQAGTFYLRLAAIDKWNQQGAFGPLSKLVLSRGYDEFPRPKLYLPYHKDIITYSAENPTVSFRWQNIRQANKYQFILAKDRSFSKVVYDTKIGINRFAIAPDKKRLIGDYYWKVEAHYASNSMRSSRIRKVNLRPDLFLDEINKAKEEEEKKENESKLLAKLPKKFKNIRNNDHRYFLFHLAPSRIDYQLGGDLVEGTTSDVFYHAYNLEAHYPTHRYLKNTFAAASLADASGKAFTNNIDFTWRDFTGNFGYIFWEKKRFFMGSAVAIKALFLSDILVDQINLTIESTSLFKTSFGVSNFIDFYQSRNLSHSVFFEFSMGGATAYKMRYQLRKRHSNKSRYVYSLGAELTRMTYDNTANIETEFSSNAVMVGLGYIF